MVTSYPVVLLSQVFSLSQIKVVCCSSQRKSLPHSRNAGLSSLRLALGANKRSTREMNAGSAFRDVLKREEERKVRRNECQNNRLGRSVFHNRQRYL